MSVPSAFERRPTGVAPATLKTHPRKIVAGLVAAAVYLPLAGLAAAFLAGCIVYYAVFVLRSPREAFRRLFDPRYNVVTETDPSVAAVGRAAITGAGRPGDRHLRIEGSSGNILHMVVRGGQSPESRAPGAPWLLFVHGFPECWFSWDALMDQLSRQADEEGPDGAAARPALLASRGFTCVAIDLRGYHLSPSPTDGGFTAFRRIDLSRDLALAIATIQRRERLGPCCVVAHDWGGLVSWDTAYLRPDLVNRLVILNSPHPRRFQEILGSSDQLKRSFYILLFSIPYLPEALERLTNFTILNRMLHTFNPQTGQLDRPLPEDDLKVYRYVMSSSGTLTAALNYYRCQLWDMIFSPLVGPEVFGGVRLPGPEQKLQTKTMVVWGENDIALNIELSKGLDRFVEDVRVRYLPGCSHWVPFDKPVEVARHVREFLSDWPQ